MDNLTKKTGVGPCVSLSPVSGGGPVQPWRRHPSTALDFAYPPRQTQPSWNVRGEQVMFTVTSPKHGTANHLNPPPPPSEEPNIRVMGGGGGQGVITKLSPRHGTANHQPPPPLRRTKQICNGEGGGHGVFIVASFKQAQKVSYLPPPNFTVASHKHGTKRRPSPP